jgi:hypothetical protein
MCGPRGEVQNIDGEKCIMGRIIFGTFIQIVVR